MRQDRNASDMRNHKQISTAVLYMLVLILLGIWMICYLAEQKLATRRIQQTFQRLDQTINIPVSQVKYAVESLTNFYSIQFKQEHNKNAIQKSDLEQVGGKQFCLLLNHKNTNEKWLSSVTSIFDQNYNLYKVVYFNNKRGSVQVQKYAEQNAIQKWKFQGMDPVTNYTQINMLQTAKSKCQNTQIIIVMDDDTVLIGNHIFSLISNQFRIDSQLSFLYGATLRLQGNQTVLGRSYQYPQQIIKQKAFNRYPFVVSGPIAFRKELLDQINIDHFKNKAGVPFKKALKVAIGLEIMRKSKGSIKFVKQILSFIADQPVYLSLDPEMKQQIKEIFSKINQ